MIDWIRERLLTDGMVSPEDLELFQLTDDPAEAVALLVAGYSRGAGSTPAAPEKADAQ
jgi:predicted Rossmann-fold nucleotide-binding protein